MPILVLGSPPSTPPGGDVGPPSNPDDRMLSFRTLTGDTLDWDCDGYTVLSDCQGLDLAPREVIRTRVPGMPGSRLVAINDLEREVRLPLWVRPADKRWQTVLDSLAQVRGFMDYRRVDYRAAEGTFDLVAHARGRERYLRCTYLTGMEGDLSAPAAMPQWRIFGVQLLAVDPDWIGDEWTTPQVALPPDRPFLSNDPGVKFGELALAPSRALGAAMPVTIGGDLPSAPIIEVHGPATSVHVTSSTVGGYRGIDITVGPVAAGHTLVVDTGRRKRVTLDGVSAPSLLAPSPQWGDAIPPGLSEITVDITGPTGATWARVSGRERWATWC